MYDFDCADTSGITGRDSPPTKPRRIHAKDILRELIAQELRAGRLTPSRRRRMVRYAAKFHLSAVDTGMLIEECRDEALESEDSEVIFHALRLIEPPPKTMPLPVKVFVAVTVAIVLYELGVRFF